MGSLGIRDENLGKFWSRSWDGAKMWMASLELGLELNFDFGFELVLLANTM